MAVSFPSPAASIATLTMNPAIDVAYEVEQLVPTHKQRCDNEQYDPGGGGLNVARIVGRLGGHAVCYYLSGGTTGATLDGLLWKRCFERRAIPISGNTRICFNMVERSTGLEYRFVPQGPTVQEQEWRAALAELERADCAYLVASGSLPRGVPADFYSRVADIARARGIRMVLDSSGDALRAGLAGGGIHLVKPSEGELARLVGHELDSHEAVGEAALDIVRSGQAEMVAVTMGGDGALLATTEGTRYLPAIQVEAKSAVGAGDSFVAAMVFALASDADPLEAFRFGMAAGSAAVLTPGTDMCRTEDVERLYRQALDA
jgi:6-phosphofructokinase 2